MNLISPNSHSDQEHHKGPSRTLPDDLNLPFAAIDSATDGDGFLRHTVPAMRAIAADALVAVGRALTDSFDRSALADFCPPRKVP